MPEKPPYQYFNFWQRNVYNWLNEINIKGLLGYDNLTDYVADLSYTIGSDGNLYQCKINNGPGTSTVNPVGDGTGTWIDVINVTPVTARGYIDGLILENDTDADHDIKINTGICRDKTDTLPIQLTVAMVKRIDANWAAGTGNGGFPSGLVLLADTWYHFYIIMKADGTVDAGFDTSLTAVNLLGDATNYIYYRYTGSVLTNGASNIIAFHQYGDEFFWDDPPQDINGAVAAASALYTLSTPLGIQVMTTMMVWGNLGVNSWSIYLSCPDVDDEAPVFGGDPVGTMAGFDAVTADSRATMMQFVRTNTSSQIRGRGTAAVNIRINTMGYVDLRGKDI